MSRYLENLNEPQKEASCHGKQPLLILAGAGSGKTRVVTTRIAWLIDQMGFDPSSILAVTFTNKAAAEMRERVAAMVPDAGYIMIRTFHSFGSWLLRRNAALLNLSPYYTIYDDDDSLKLLASLFPGNPRSELKRRMKEISRAKDENLSPEDDLSSISQDYDFREYYAKYEETLRDIGNVDFGDLIALPVRLLKEHEAVRKRILQKFKVILVDEYQDSNTAQFQMLRQLSGPDTWLCVVGDDDQSIYRFRGAEVKNILNFQNEFPGTKIIKLEENYRSSGHILSIASTVVAHNEGRLGKTLWTKNPEGNKPSVHSLTSAEEEASFCANLIKKSPLTETAILYRTNAQSRLFETELTRQNIPYRIVGSLRFYEREEIKDLLAFLALTVNPADYIALSRVINKPARGIGKVSLGKLRNIKELWSHERCQAHDKVTKVLKGKALKGTLEFLDLLAKLEESIETDELPEFIQSIISASGLLEYHRSQDDIQGSSKVENMEELINAASQFPRGKDGLVEFLESIELDQSALQEEGEQNVILITMHNTKGLEFDRVIITGLEEDLFPRGGEWIDPDELEEERRLFYVSITRARKDLLFTWCQSRRIHGRMNFGQASRFLAELPSENVNRDDGGSEMQNAYKQGTRVYQEEYGEGVVIKHFTDGPYLVVVVQFNSGRTAQFLPEFNALEILGNVLYD